MIYLQGSEGLDSGQKAQLMFWEQGLSPGFPCIQTEPAGGGIHLDALVPSQPLAGKGAYLSERLLLHQHQGGPRVSDQTIAVLGENRTNPSLVLRVTCPEQPRGAPWKRARWATSQLNKEKTLNGTPLTPATHSNP